MGTRERTPGVVQPPGAEHEPGIFASSITSERDLHLIDAVRLEQWVEVAASAHIHSLLLTAKHHDGSLPRITPLFYPRGLALLLPQGMSLEPTVSADEKSRSVLCGSFHLFPNPYTAHTVASSSWRDGQGKTSEPLRQHSSSSLSVIFH
jgi:hypothetical protein